MTKTCKIEKFTNLSGETRFRFVTESTLHPGKPNRSLAVWETYSGAYKAARADGYKIEAGR